MCSYSSCTDPLQVLPGLSSETFTTSSNAACNFCDIEVRANVDVKEEGFIAIKEEVDIGIKQEEIPKDVTFPYIKSEPDESCTDPLQVLPGLSSETFPTSSDFSNIEVEEDVVVIEEDFQAINEGTAVRIKEEVIPQDVNFAGTKSEPDEGTINGTFSEQGAMKQHQEIHTVERTYSCDVCDRKFKGLSALMLHQRAHQRPHRCDVCNEAFRLSKDLKKHQRAHAGQRPVVCNNTFRRLGNLKLHHHVHTEECPHRCDVCINTFSYKRSLKVHQHVHNEEHPYHCDKCNKTFKRLGNLKLHQRVHTEECPYRCSQKSYDYDLDTKFFIGHPIKYATTPPY